MSKEITELLKEATKDLLSEESLKVVSEAFQQKVNEKVTLAVESALVQLDEEHAKELEKVLNAIDVDHTIKLNKIVDRIDESHSVKFQHALDSVDVSHSAKLNKIVGLYESAMKSEAETFKNTLVENISNFIELYIDKVIPKQQIQEATQNARSRQIIDEVKRLVSLDEAYVTTHIKEALVDGKNQIDESSRKILELTKQNKLLTEKTESTEKQLFLEKKLANFPVAKKDYMFRVLSQKNMKQITENFDYVASMFDKKEDEEVDTLKETTEHKTKGTDITIAPDLLDESKSYSSADTDEGASDVASNYLTEFTRKAY